MQRIVVGITGASGAIYGLRLVEELLRANRQVTVLVTSAGRQVLAFETGLTLPQDAGEALPVLRKRFAAGDNLQHFALSDFFAPIASGTSAPDATVVCPCSMGTLGRIAAGLSDNLLERVADVALKERRQLLLVPRETPLSALHLENMLKLSHAGAQVLPAMPGFYGQPRSVEELVDFMVGKVLDQLGVEHALFKRWGEI